VQPIDPSSEYFNVMDKNGNRYVSVIHPLRVYKTTVFVPSVDITQVVPGSTEKPKLNASDANRFQSQINWSTLL
jgi:hypothetical protein